MDNPKGDPSPNWFVENFVDKDGDFAAMPEPPVALDNCTITPTPVPGCKTDPEVSDLTSITFKYTGADCSASDNNQDSGKWDCSGVPGPDPVSITVNKDTNKTSANKTSLSVGDEVTLGNEFGSETELMVGEQSLKIHTSCSQPLEIGDVFGSLEVVGINGQRSGSDVTYTYEITNIGDTTVLNVAAEDDVYGTLPGSPIAQILPGESVTLQVDASVSEDTTNTVTVTGETGGDRQCRAEDTVTVTVEKPPPGPVVCTTKVQAMLLRYTGTTPLTNVEFDPDKGDSVTYATVTPGDILTMPAQNDWTIDATVSGEEELGAKTKILVNGVLTEIIHTSCSAPFEAGAPAPLDGGSPGVPGNPDPDKGDPSPNWFVESFVQK